VRIACWGLRLRLARDFQISIRAGLSIGVVAVVVLTAAIVHIPWSLTSQTNVAELNGRLNSLVIRSIAEKVDHLLDDAVAVRQAIATDLVNDEGDMDDVARRQFLFLSFLESQPSLTAIEFGRPDNHSFLALRSLDGTIRIEETIPNDPRPMGVTDTYRLGGSGDFVFEHREKTPSDYKVTQQLWFLTAFDKDRPPWSNIYRLPATGNFGVTTSSPVERNGELLGAIGVSISLARLSAFLDGIDVSAHGMVFLTNTYDELVAVQSPMRAAMGGMTTSPNILKLEDIGLPAVRVAVAALKANGAELQSLDRGRQFTFRDAATRGTYFVTLAPLTQMGLIVCVVIPEGDILGAIDRNTRILLVALGAFIVLIGFAATFAARRAIGRPLARVTENLRQLENFQLDSVETIPSRFTEIRQVSAATARMRTSLASFKKYIPTDLVRTLFAQGIEAELGGERRDLTILFMDLADFTHISEMLGDRLIEFLGVYLSEMSDEIQAGGGTIDKYIGDAIMAFWGAPMPSERHALEGCRAALACQARVGRLRTANRGRDIPDVRVRIGVNTGRVLVGNVGSHDRLNYTAIGDPVNVASRLESLNKIYGTEIIIGENTYEAAREHIVARPLDRVAVYGKEMGLEMYELLAMRDAADVDAMMAWIAVYEEARTALRTRAWDDAIRLFERVIAMRGGRDGVSSVQIARARAYMASPPPDDWDGLVIMEAK
jgi:adenylate cyclase